MVRYLAEQRGRPESKSRVRKMILNVEYPKWCCIRVLNKFMIIGRQTQLRKLHTGIRLCVFVCVFGHPCLCVQAAARGELEISYLSFLSIMLFSFVHSVLLPATLPALVLLTIHPLPILYHVFLPHIFVRLHLCLHFFAIMAPPFYFLFLPTSLSAVIFWHLFRSDKRTLYL